MRAAVVHSFDAPPRWATFELPVPREGEVVVDVLACGLSPRARSGASGKHYSSSGQLPVVAGIDGVGVLPDGQRAYFLSFDGPMGTMAEQTVVSAQRCIPLPAGADPVTVAAGVVPALSSWAALRARAQLQPGQSVLVLGATGVAGTLAVQAARALGAGRVVAAGRDRARLEATTSLGADALVDLAGPPEVVAAHLAEQAGDVDVVLDYLWGPVTENALDAVLHARTRDDHTLRWVQIGSVAGPRIALPSAALRSRDLRLLGSGQGSMSAAALDEQVPSLLDAVVAGALRVASRAVDLADVEAAWVAPEEGGRRTVLVVR